MYNKITVGYVIQKFDDDGNAKEQEFIASDEVCYEEPDGTPLDSIEIGEEQYLPFEMKQPE